MNKLLGANLENMRSNSAARLWTDPAVFALLPQLHLGYGRWPGGTCANYWNWRTGTFSASGNPKEGITAGRPNPPLPATLWFANCAVAKCASLIQLNICTEPTGKFVVDGPGLERQIADQLSMLASLPPGTVQYLELGNEIYRHADPACAFYAANPVEYVGGMTRLVAELRQLYPAARIGACSLADPYKPLNPTWRSTIEAGLAGVVDAFTYHHYLPIPEAPTSSNVDALVADALADWNHALGSTIATMPAGHTAWFTEWNYDDRSPNAAAMVNTPAHGYVMSALAIAHLATPEVELTGPHATVGSAGSLYAAIAETGGAPALTTYGQALAAVGWQLKPQGPPPFVA